MLQILKNHSIDSIIRGQNIWVIDYIDLNTNSEVYVNLKGISFDDFRTFLGY